MDNELLVKSVRELCKKNNITPSQLENELNFGAGLISRWAKSSPSIDKIIDIADYFKVTLDEVVGRNQNLSDDFLTTLYNQTVDNLIEWLSEKEMKARNYQVKIYNRMEDSFGNLMYDEDEFTESTYGFKYLSGYIMLYAFHRHGKISQPKEVLLFIQPSDSSFLVEQDYEQNELIKLWSVMLNSLFEYAPDEIKANDLKINFIRSRMDRLLSYAKINGYYEEYIEISEKIKNLPCKDGCVLFDIKSNLILEQDTTTGVTYIAKEFYHTYKDKLGEVNCIIGEKGNIVYLVSDSKIMQLSGFSFGKHAGMTGYNGMIETFQKIGFDTSETSKFNNNRFILTPNNKITTKTSNTAEEEILKEAFGINITDS